MSQFNAGNVISRSFSLWARNLAPFTAMSLVIFIPLFLFSAWALQREGGLFMNSMVLGVNYAGAAFLGPIVTGAVTYAVLQQLRGRAVTLGELVGVGLRRMFPILLLTLVAFVVFFVSAFFLLVPAVILGVMFWLSVPVAVVERPGLFGALGRSVELSSGYRWPILGVILVLLLFSWFAVLCVQVVLGVFQLGPESSTAAFAAYALVLLLAQSLLNSLIAVGCAVTYHDLRIAKEGVDTEALAAVFD